MVEKLGKMGIPGFRSGKKWKIIVAIFGYFWISVFIMVLILPTPTPPAKSAERAPTPNSTVATTISAPFNSSSLSPSQYNGKIRYYIGTEISLSMQLVGKDLVDYGDGIISLDELNRTIRSEKYIANITLKNIQSLNVPMGYEVTQRRAIVIVETYIDALTSIEKYFATSEDKYLTYYQDDLNKIVRQTKELITEIEP